MKLREGMESEENSGRGADSGHLRTPSRSFVRCKSTRVYRGEVVRCVAERGHSSAHYTGKTWWENTNGLPRTHLTPTGWTIIFAWLLCAGAVGAFIYWLVALR